MHQASCRVEENTAAEGIELGAHQVERLNHAHAGRRGAARQRDMAVIDR